MHLDFYTLEEDTEIIGESDRFRRFGKLFLFAAYAFGMKNGMVLILMQILLGFRRDPIAVPQRFSNNSEITLQQYCNNAAIVLQ